MNKLICAAASFLVLAGTASAHCRVQCVQAVEQFVAVPYALPVGVPVATYGAVGYSYQPLNVTVNINGDEIAQKVVERLTAPPTPGPLKAEAPSPVSEERRNDIIRGMGTVAGAPPPPNPDLRSTVPATAIYCLKCHGPGGKAVDKLNLFDLSKLTCEQRLAAARKVLAQKMPPGKPLSAEATGDVLEELVGK